MAFKLRNEYYFMDKTQDKLRNDIILIDYNMDIIEGMWHSKNIGAIKKHLELVMLNRDKKELEELYKIDKRVEKYIKK